MRINLDIYTMAIIMSLLGVTFIVVWLKFTFRKICFRFVNLRKENLQIKNNIKIITTGALGISEKINKLQNEIKYLNRNNIFFQGKSNLPPDEESIYSKAMMIASQGGMVQDIVETCKISNEEAELIITSMNKIK